MRVRYSFSSRRTRTIDPFNDHRTAFPKIAREVIRISDVLLEVLDARFIEKTRNKAIEQEIKKQNKILIYVINKVDLVDINNLKKELEQTDVSSYALISCKVKIGKKNLLEKIKIEVKRLKLIKRAHVGIIGYPNTGKSSLINFLSGRSSTGTSAESGYTKGIQKIRINQDICLLDTPGVIPEGENSNINRADLVKHTEISVRTYDKVKNPEFVVVSLMKSYPNIIESFYNIDAKGNAEMLLEELGRKKHFLLKGNEVDIDRTARLIIKDWQKGDIRKD